MLRTTIPIPQWWLYGEGHLLAGAIVELNDQFTEAQILLDGMLIYGSRHVTRAVAEQELAALRGKYASEGWAEAD